MAQLAEMGVAIPQEYRADMALAGEWQTLSETKIEDREGLEGAARSIGVRKRKHEGDDEEEDHAPEPLESKGWGSRMKTYPGAQDDDDEDLDALLASTKDLKKPKTAMPVAATEEAEEQKQELAPVPKTEDGTPDSKAPGTEETTVVKKEEPNEFPAPPIDEKAPSEETTGFVFKKRKSKVMRK